MCVRVKPVKPVVPCRRSHLPPPFALSCLFSLPPLLFASCVKTSTTRSARPPLRRRAHAPLSGCTRDSAFVFTCECVWCSSRVALWCLSWWWWSTQLYPCVDLKGPRSRARVFAKHASGCSCTCCVPRVWSWVSASLFVCVSECVSERVRVCVRVLCGARWRCICASGPSPPSFSFFFLLPSSLFFSLPRLHSSWLVCSLCTSCSASHRRASRGPHHTHTHTHMQALLPSPLHALFSINPFSSSSARLTVPPTPPNTHTHTSISPAVLPPCLLPLHIAQHSARVPPSGVMRWRRQRRRTETACDGLARVT